MVLLVYTLMGIIYRNLDLIIVTCVTFSKMDFMISPLRFGVEFTTPCLRRASTAPKTVGWMGRGKAR